MNKVDVEPKPGKTLSYLTLNTIKKPVKVNWCKRGRKAVPYELYFSTCFTRLSHQRTI